MNGVACSCSDKKNQYNLYQINLDVRILGLNKIKDQPSHVVSVGQEKPSTGG
jgi:hypothetical protein